MKTFLGVLCALLCGATAQAETLADILARMDQAAREFHSLSATMKRVHFTSVLGESEEIDGVVRLKRAKGGASKVGTTGVLDFRQPEQRTIFIKGKSVQVFYPKANTVEFYDTSKYASNIDQIILLGFGTTSAELRGSYDLADGGTQNLNGSDTTRIVLTPKPAELKKLITRIEMWFPQGQSNPVRVKFSEPSGDYEVVDYSDIKVNPALPDSAFEPQFPANAKKIYPQK